MEGRHPLPPSPLFNKKPLEVSKGVSASNLYYVITSSKEAILAGILELGEMVALVDGRPSPIAV